MKKISKILMALLLVIVAVFGVAGCNADTQSELQSKIDELQSRIEDLQSQNAEMQSQIEELKQEIERKSDLLRENAKAGLYSLQTAYDMGLLTREDLMSIAYYQNGGRVYNEEIMSDNYAPQPKIPEILSENTELKIKEMKAVCDNNNPQNELWKGSFAAEKYLFAYLGTYNGCIGVRTRNHLMAIQVIFRVKIADVTFILPDPAYDILIYVEGNK